MQTLLRELICLSVLAGALMLEQLGETGAARRIERAVEETMREGAFRTRDMGGSDGTDKVGRLICERVLREA